MIEEPQCPLCGSAEQKDIGSRTYRRADAESGDEYLRSRLSVLFDIWFPGSDEVRLASQLCRHCGFVGYAPRPEDADLDAKYRYLGSLPDGGVGQRRVDPESASERERARRLFRRLRRYLGKTSRVLDFGGGDGRLMRDMVREGHVCHLVDYAEPALAGIEKLGDTLPENPPEEKYDLAICSHVLEHVANPVGIVRDLSRWLKPGGLLYVEVPMEIWKRAPLLEEPVTHVNFFTPWSVETMILRGGMDVRRSRLERYDHPTGREVLVVRAIAVATEPPESPVPPEPDTESFLHPGARRKLQRAWLTPRSTLRETLRRFAR